ncbi:hypothetical protein Tco_1213141 [Tanacetum coccineum]
MGEGQGDVKGGGVDFGVINSLLGEIPREFVNEYDDAHEMEVISVCLCVTSTVVLEKGSLPFWGREAEVLELLRSHARKDGSVLEEMERVVEFNSPGAKTLVRRRALSFERLE